MLVFILLIFIFMLVFIFILVFMFVFILLLVFLFNRFAHSAGPMCRRWGVVWMHGRVASHDPGSW